MKKVIIARLSSLHIALGQMETRGLQIENAAKLLIEAGGMPRRSLPSADFYKFGRLCVTGFANLLEIAEINEGMVMKPATARWQWQKALAKEFMVWVDQNKNLTYPAKLFEQAPPPWKKWKREIGDKLQSGTLRDW